MTTTIRGNIGTHPVKRTSKRGPFATFSLVRNTSDGDPVWYNVLTDDYSDRIMSLRPGDKVLIDGSVTTADGRRTLRPDNITILRRGDHATCLL